MGWLWWFIGGGLVGLFVMGVFAGGTQNERLKQAFDDGYNAGKRYKD